MSVDLVESVDLVSVYLVVNCKYEFAWTASSSGESRYAWRTGGPRTLSKTTEANLNCEFAKNTLFTPILDGEKPTKHNWVSDQTWM